MQLLMVDTTGTQGYIFGSNRLRENIGGSHRVAQATREWALRRIRDSAPKSNIRDNLNLDNGKRIERDGLDAEVVYTGGGNVLVLFKDAPTAQRFTRAYSRQLLREAPGLDVAIESCEFDPAKNDLAAALAELQRGLKIRKRSRIWSAPLLGLGVTRTCQSTGLPAVDFATMGSERKYAVSADIRAKHRVWQEADDRFKTLADPYPYTYPHELDDLGRSEGGHSYIAVVHVDSNDMGSRIQNLITAHQDNTRDGIDALREFSRALDDTAEKTLQCLTKTLIGNIESYRIEHPDDPDLFVPLAWTSNRKEKCYLPFRPLVVGGDDITFVCDGRLGLSLALLFLCEFERSTKNLPDGGGGASACAGVAIVKSHYPFARAYALAEELCANAKRFRLSKEIQGSCLDWHYSSSGLTGSINAIRDREYNVAAGSLTIKPLALDAEAGLHTWLNVQAALHAFQTSNAWVGKRNKLKTLREVLRGGADEVKWFLAKYDGELPKLDYGVGSEITISGWENRYCPYFDAIEAGDWYIPLEADSTRQEANHDA